MRTNIVVAEIAALDLRAVEGKEVALFVFGVVCVAQNHLMPGEPRVKDELAIVIHRQLVGEGIPKRVVLGGIHKTEPHVRLGLALDMHDGDVRCEMRIQSHPAPFFVEVVIFACAGHVHAQHRMPLPNVNVDGAVHLAVHLCTFAGSSHL